MADATKSPGQAAWDSIAKQELEHPESLMWNILYAPDLRRLTIRPALSEEEFVTLLDKSVMVNLPTPADRKTALEIGLGQGGSHLVLRALFSRVVSLEINRGMAYEFAARFCKDPQSPHQVVCCDSQLPHTAGFVSNAALKREPVDFLLLDGLHRNRALATDFFNHIGLVRRGGVVAFAHAIRYNSWYEFLAGLEAGKYADYGPEYEDIKITFYESSYGGDNASGMAAMVKTW